MIHYIFGEIDEEVAGSVISAANSGDLSELWICSSGGDLSSALAMYDVLIRKDIKIVGSGAVQSAGLIVFLAGSERVATANTRFLSHEISLVLEDDAEPTQEDMDEMALLHKVICGIFVDRCGMTEKKATALTKGSTTFGLQEAIKMGFAHKEWKDDASGLRSGVAGFRSVEARKRKRA